MRPPKTWPSCVVAFFNGSRRQIFGKLRQRLTLENESSVAPMWTCNPAFVSAGGIVTVVAPEEVNVPGADSDGADAGSEAAE